MVNELRIGNYLLGYDNNYFTWDYGHFDLCSKGIDTDELGMPIQLTEEILLKCKGVKRINEWQYKLNDWFLIERYTTKEKWSVRKVISEENSILLCFIDFLHEFQNIIHALTNQELNIEL